MKARFRNCPLIQPIGTSSGELENNSSAFFSICGAFAATTLRSTMLTPFDIEGTSLMFQNPRYRGRVSQTEDAQENCLSGGVQLKNLCPILCPPCD
jgi:hypothetical protein